MRANRYFYATMRSFAGFPYFFHPADRRGRCILVSLASGAVFSLGGCADSPMQQFASAHPREYFPSSIYGAASPRVVADGEPVPHGGGMYMVGKPYSIAGRTYYPSEKHYAQTGLASWYGDAFHGRRTANGEVYDRDAISAAHPTMPLPSYARVTNLSNHYSMIVRVNDRGPFAGNRIMDVSRKTAEVLDFRRSGTTRVKVEYIGAASLAGSDDQLLLATLRTNGPASLEALDDREHNNKFAENAPYPVAAADTRPTGVVASDAGAAPETASAGRASGREVPLPPARPYGLGKTPGTSVPIALR